MYNISLHIKPKDWLYILFVGVLFGLFLSLLIYMILGYSWLHGALLGFLIGFCITLFSLVFISYMNKNILPKLKEIYWSPLSALFSFLSGFLGTLSGTFLAKFLSLELIEAFEEEIITISFFIGILTYIVGILLYRFVKMRNQKDMIDHEYVQSRLRSLETQLNPHFLFNALNSIAELIHQDAQRAEEAILKVSSFLRNSMNEKALLSMEDEIRNVKDYVELENIRFLGKIHLHILSQSKSLQVPKFSIQLLVENAIKHGYNPKKESLNIWVSWDEPKGTILVKNDGNPMQSQKFGVGLVNLQQRVLLLCHGDIKIVALDEPTFELHLGDCYENFSRR